MDYYGMYKSRANDMRSSACPQGTAKFVKAGRSHEVTTKNCLNTGDGLLSIYGLSARSSSRLR